MPDMLVKLYALPDLVPATKDIRKRGIEIRRALVPEQHVVVDWVRQRWGEAWASECAAAFARRPVSCFVATAGDVLVGFSCHEVTCRNFFGPFGVDSAYQRRGVGAALLLTTLHDMKAQGYGYAIIGGVGAAGFFTRVAGAQLIDDSTPGIYEGMLRR